MLQREALGDAGLSSERGMTLQRRVTPFRRPSRGSFRLAQTACSGLHFRELSEVYHPRTDNRQVVDDYSFLRDRLDYLYGMFGEDRVIFGTDYPNSERRRHDIGGSGAHEEILRHQDPCSGREVLLEERCARLQVRQARQRPAGLTGSGSDRIGEIWVWAID